MKTLIHSLALALISFTLSALPIQEARAQAVTTERESLVQDENGNQPNVVKGPQSEEESAVGVYYDSEGYAVVTKRIQTEGGAFQETSDALTMVLLIAIGVFAARLWKYRPMTTDMKIAMAAGVIMIGATIHALATAKKNIDDKEYKVTIREDGTVTNMQREAIEQEIKSYQELEKLAGIKWKIESAGAVAFTGAAGMAMMNAARWNAARTGCQDALIANNCPAAFTAQVEQEAALEITTGSSLSDQAAIQVRQGRVQALTNSCLGAAPPATAAAAIAAAHAGCMEAHRLAVSQTAGGAAAALQTPMSHPSSGEGLELFVFDFYDRAITESELISLWTDRSLIHSSPYQGLFVNNSAITKFDQRLHSGLRGFDANRFNNGQLASLSVDQYYLLKDRSERYLEGKLEAQVERHARSLKTMLGQLVLSDAHAFGMKELGLTGAVLGFFISTFMRQANILDRMMATPRRRALAYGIAAGISVAAAILSKKIEGKMGENVKKLQELLKQMDRLKDTSVAGTGNTTVTPNLYESLAPRNIQQPTRLSDDERLPCPNPSTDGKCPSMKEEFEKQSAISSFGAPMATLATSTGQMADNMLGNDPLGAASLADANNLASQGAVADRMLDHARKSYNDVLKKRGGAPFDFDKESNKFRDELKRATIKSLQDTKGGNSAVAAFGSGGLRPIPESANKPVELDEEAVAALMEEAPVEKNDGNKGDEMNFEFFGEDEFAYDPNLDNAIMGADGLIRDIDGGGESTDDIVNNRDVSLFQIITVRYFKSGFPRLFELNE